MMRGVRGIRPGLPALAIVCCACMLVLAGCWGGSKPAPTPLAGASLAARDPVHQTETCAPDSDPLALVLPSLVRITTRPDSSGTFSSGTGIIVNQGWILTNEHVIDLAGSASV